MAALVETIKSYFERYGWQCEFDEDTTTWITGFRGRATNFNILVHLTDNWLYFIISPFVNGPDTDECEQRLFLHLLQLNHTINMAKFSIDSDGDVALTVELPTESLTYSQFRDGLNAVSYYADAHYVDLVNLAQNPGYVVPEQDNIDDVWPLDFADHDRNKPN